MEFIFLNSIYKVNPQNLLIFCLQTKQIIALWATEQKTYDKLNLSFL
jgi:hypothetical protein